MSRLPLMLSFTLGLSCGRPPSPPSDISLLHRTNLSGTHLPSCDDAACGDGHNPPLGGPHCSITLSCRAYDTAQPRCQWIHNLEHGHLVLAYHCPEACPEVVSQLEAIRDAQRAQGNSRVIITPDEQLPSRVAALVWGWGWGGETVDAEAIAAVIAKQDVDAPESELSCAP